VTVGNRSRFIPSPYRALPDILDHTREKYMEIKPLSVSGIAAAIAQMSLREHQFESTGYSPDVVWESGLAGLTPIQINSLPRTVYIMNFQGVIFYTDILDNLEDIIGLASLALARHAFLSRAILYAGARAAIFEAVSLGASVKTIDAARFDGHLSIAGLLAVMGGVGF